MVDAVVRLAIRKHHNEVDALMILWFRWLRSLGAIRVAD